MNFGWVREVERIWEELRGGEMTIRIYNMKKFIFNKDKVLSLNGLYSENRSYRIHKEAQISDLLKA